MRIGYICELVIDGLIAKILNSPNNSILEYHGIPSDISDNG